MCVCVSRGAVKTCLLVRLGAARGTKGQALVVFGVFCSDALHPSMRHSPLPPGTARIFIREVCG